MTKCKVILDKRMGCRSPNTKVLFYPYIEDTHNTNVEHSENQLHEDGVSAPKVEKLIIETITHGNNITVRPPGRK